MRREDEMTVLEIEDSMVPTVMSALYEKIVEMRTRGAQSINLSSISAQNDRRMVAALEDLYERLARL